MKKFIAGTCFMAISYGLIAQNTIPEKYQYKLSGNIEMIEKAPGGYVLIGTSDGLNAIEANSSTIKYTYSKMGKIKPEEMQILPNTPYIILTRGYNKVIFDYTTGKEVFTQAENGWGAIISITPDFSNGTIMVLGTSNKGSYGYAMGVYDILNFSKKGWVDFTDKKQMGAYINATTYFESEGKLFVRTDKGIVCIDKTALTIDWIYSDLERTSSVIKVIADPTKEEYYVAESNIKDHYLHKLNASGTLTTKKPLKLQGIPQRLELTSNALFVHAAEGKTTYFELFSRQTGDKIWKDAYEIDGPIFQSFIQENFIFYAAQKGEINTVDIATGKSGLSKDIKTGPTFNNIQFLSDNVLLYLTSNNMGVINYKTGQELKESTKFKKVVKMLSALDEKNDRLVVSTGTELFFIKKDGTITKVTDIDFKGDEAPNKIEFRESGILVSGSQNNMLVSYDGKIVYNSYFKAPGQSLLGKIAMGAMTVALASQSVGYNNAGMYKSAAQSNKAANGMIGEMNKKFKATSSTKNHLYVLTQLKDGTGLVKLNKDTGKVIAEILLNDKKPEYAVDDDYEVMYFKKEKNLVTGYELN